MVSSALGRTAERERTMDATPYERRRRGRPAARRRQATWRCRQRHRRGEAGFSLVEVIVALAVLAIVLTGVGIEIGVQSSAINQSRNKQAAQGLLDKALAEVRALPYTDVKSGLKTSDTTTTGTKTVTHIKKTGTVWTFTDPGLAATGETVLHSTYPDTTPPVPLYKHTASTATVNKVNNLQFSVSTFPTTTSTSTVLRVTVIVSWTTPEHHVAKSINSQTLLYSFGSPCTEGEPLPFGAPCNPNFTASATAGSGVIQVQAPTTTPLEGGGTFRSLDLDIPGSSSSSNLIQSSSVEGWAQAGAALRTPGDNTGRTTRISTAASNDPASPDYSTATRPDDVATLHQSTTAKEPATYKVTSTQDSITATPSSGDTGTSVSTISAKSGQKCDKPTGTQQVTTQPCTSSTANQNGKASLTATLYDGDAHLGTAVLAKVTRPASGPNGVGDEYPDRTFDAHYVAGTASCPSTRTNGCIDAGARMSLGTVSLGGLPSGFSPPATNWTTSKGLVGLSNFSASVATSADGGTTSGHVGSATPTIPISGPKPQISYWNGSTYTPITLTGATVAFTSSVTTTQMLDGVAVTVTISAHLTADNKSITVTTTASCTMACTANVSLTPLHGNITYKVTQGSTVIANLIITVNLGSLAAHSSYQAAS